MRTVVLTLAIATLLSAQDRRITPIAVNRKQALVIGNSAYARAPLQNAGNDAVAMEDTLRKLGFEVRTVRDLDLPHMEAAIDDFTAGLSSGSLAFFYFSGHGIQVNYTNYLLPVDFAASSEIDVKYKAYPATRIQEKMEGSGARLRVLVLDACRNNPFRYKRDALGGLAAMPVNAEGTLIAFATGDNNTADDNRAQANGLYTKYLMPALLTPGLQLREAFQKAKEDVYRASAKMQNPSIYENVVGAYYLVAPPLRESAAAKIDAAAETWALIKDSQDPEDFEKFARAFPSSDLARGAEIRAAQLRRRAAPAVPAANPATDPPKNPNRGRPAPIVSGQPKQWKIDEYPMYEAMTKEVQPGKRLDLIAGWEQRFPATDYEDIRQQAYLQTYSAAMTAGYASTDPQVLSTAVKSANVVMSDLETLFFYKPDSVSDGDWATAKKQVKAMARNMPGYVALQQKDYARAEAELIKSLDQDPNQGSVSFWLFLAAANQRIPAKMLLALFSLARSAMYEGEGALDAATRQKYKLDFENRYQRYHGAADGMVEVENLARTIALPPPYFKLSSR